MAQFYVLKSEKQCTSVPQLKPFHTEEADDCCATVHTFPGATSTCTILQPDTFKWWSLLQIEIARHGWSWEEFRRTDESFVFLLIDADILSCLLLPHLAELKPSNWHVASLRYAACIRFHFASSLSFVSPSYGFLSRRFLPCGSLDAPPYCSNHSHLSHHLIVFIPPTSFVPQNPAGLRASHLPFKLPSSLLSPRVIFPTFVPPP